MNKLFKSIFIFMLLIGFSFGEYNNFQYFDCIKDWENRVVKILDKYGWGNVDITLLSKAIQLKCNSKYQNNSYDKYVDYNSHLNNKYIVEDIVDNDVNSLISIKNVSDIYKKRSEVISYIWGGDKSQYLKWPFSIEKDIKLDDLFSGYNNIDSIDKITVLMDYNINSISYVFHAKNQKDHLVIFHQGHEPGINGGVVHKESIQTFIDNGFSVLVVSMPLNGTNNNPIVSIPNVGKIRLSFHDQLPYLKNHIKFFLEPLYAIVNYASSLGEYSTINMVGFYGGGWATTMYSAIDDRIKNTYSIAGTYPIDLRYLTTPDWGDNEQWWPDLYKISSYYDLYIMGSYGSGRSQIQILNQYDQCCFWGLRYQKYETKISEIISKLGSGGFKVLLDSNYKAHGISKYVLEKIIDDIEK